MSLPSYYISVNPSGDICLVFRMVNPISYQPFPIMMRDEYGKVLSYAEQGPHNYGCLPASLVGSNEIFTRIEISKENYELIGHSAFFCYYYEKRGRKILLRPGHRRVKVDPGMWAGSRKEYYRTEVSDPDNLELCMIAYGGRPIYWIKCESEKSHTDYSELAAHGCLHPLKYKPRNRSF